MFFFFKQKTAYEMRISDWSSDVCSSDLNASDDCLDIESTQRGIIGTQFFTHQLGETLDKLGRDSAFRVCELPFEHDDIGLNMDKLFGQFAMLLGEARVGGREMPGEIGRAHV